MSRPPITRRTAVAASVSSLVALAALATLVVRAQPRPGPGGAAACSGRTDRLLVGRSRASPGNSPATATATPGSTTGPAATAPTRCGFPTAGPSGSSPTPSWTGSTRRPARWASPTAGAPSDTGSTPLPPAQLRRGDVPFGPPGADPDRRRRRSGTRTVLPRPARRRLALAGPRERGAPHARLAPRRSCGSCCGTAPPEPDRGPSECRTAPRSPRSRSPACAWKASPRPSARPPSPTRGGGSSTAPRRPPRRRLDLRLRQRRPAPDTGLQRLPRAGPGRAARPPRRLALLGRRALAAAGRRARYRCSRRVAAAGSAAPSPSSATARRGC